MMRLECMHAVTLLQSRVAGLSQASALRLEDHLSQCPDCSEQAHWLDGLRALSDAGARPLAASARQRAVLQAFAVAERPSQPIVSESSWLVPSTCGALLAVAIVSLAIVQQPVLAPGADYRVVSGELEHTSLAAGGGSARIETAIATRTGGIAVLAHASVEFRPQTQARWDGEARVLRLEQGSVGVDVDPSPHQTFRVDTERFRVLVLGTRFEVSRSDVRVTRGQVRVTAPNGAELALLGPGESYACAQAPCQPRVERPEPTAAGAANRLGSRPAAASGETAPASAPEARAEPSKPLESSARTSEASRAVQPLAVDHRLEQVRIALGRRDVARARELVGTLLAEQLPSRDRAEALSLRAECALVDGDLAGAAADYRLVARRFSKLPAGENALFASARIDADRLAGMPARAGLTQYLARYPRGRFVKEATTRLRELELTSQP
jgi:ferric-dicitrate binding protein FerR (iron transport regulator)